MQEISFEYANDWICRDVADAEGTPYKFYLTKGQHTIRLEATLGTVGPLISQMQDSIYRLNLIYRTILVLTGTTPDADRDYELKKVFPDEVDAMLERVKTLAVKASTDTLTDLDRAYIQEETTRITEEINRINKNTTFNEKQIFYGGLDPNNWYTEDSSLPI